MNEPNKHRRRAEPKRAARPERASRSRGARVKEPAASGTPGSAAGESRSLFAWLRTIPGLIVFAVVVIGAALGIRLLVTSGDDDAVAGAGAPAPVNAANGQFANEWTTLDGSRYEVTIKTLSNLVQGPSSTGCLQPLRADSTKLSFQVVITNKSDREARVPKLDFGTDLGKGGLVDAALQKAMVDQQFGKLNRTLEITPPVPGETKCAEIARLRPTGRDVIPAGGSVEFTGTFGPLALPVKNLPTVAYRYYAADGTAEKPTILLAPFARF